MVMIISEIMQDRYSSYDHFKMMHISKEHCDVWMECFIKALNELEIDENSKTDLCNKMQKCLEEMMRLRYMSISLGCYTNLFES